VSIDLDGRTRATRELDRALPLRRRPAGASSRRDFLSSVDDAMYEVIATHGRETRDVAVSVIVPTRDQRHLLKDTLAALLRQPQDPAFEVVVVDDCSSDGTARLLEQAATGSATPFVAVRLRRRGGAAMARNAGVTLARGRYLAFMDSDVVPAAGWLRALIAGFEDGIGVVQGPTYALPGQRQPLFSHFIETTHLDGTFCTSNVAYRRRALEETGGFDPSCDYWEDADLGWCVREANWGAAFAPSAVTHHQVIAISPVDWLWRARQFVRRPAIAARHRAYRRHLFLGVWVDPWHVLLDLAAIGLLLGRYRRRFLLLGAPYVMTLPLRRGLRGRWPLLKACAHVARDVVALIALIGGSARYRAPVL